MDRSRLVPLAVALLCIAALGVAATTLESTLTTDPDEEIDPDWDRLPIGQDQAQSIKEEMGDGDEGDGGASEQRESSDPVEEGESQENAGGGGTDDETVESGSAGEADESAGEAEQDSGSGVGEGSSHGGIPTLLGLLLSLLVSLLKALVVLALVVGAAVLAYRHRERFLAALDRSSPADEQEEDAGQTAAESWPRDDPSSAVDRAWLELVRLVDPERPATMTPREFAAAARESGLDSRAVDAITGAFERTHYGGVQPEEEEPRARDALDRLREQVGQGGTDRTSTLSRSDGGEPRP